MTHVLDKPAWSALTGRHADFAEGGSHARRYQPSIVPFAGMLDNAPQSLQALAALVKSEVARWTPIIKGAIIKAE